MAPHTALLLLSCATLASAVACIASDERGVRPGVYLFKPLTMLIVLAIAWWSGDAAAPAVRHLVLAGLVFSLAGDVFLMLPSDRFVPGLASFLVAHFLYIAAFAVAAPSPAGWVALPFAAFGIGYYRFLLPDLGGVRIPVAVYVAAISAMAWLASARVLEDARLLPGLACAGALLFVVSDAALAWNRFHARIPRAQVLVLGTYFSAQWLIALSLGGGAWLFGGAAS